MCSSSFFRIWYYMSCTLFWGSSSFTRNFWSGLSSVRANFASVWLIHADLPLSISGLLHKSIHVFLVGIAPLHWCCRMVVLSVLDRYWGTITSARLYQEHLSLCNGDISSSFSQHVFEFRHWFMVKHDLHYGSKSTGYLRAFTRTSSDKAWKAGRGIVRVLVVEYITYYAFSSLYLTGNSDAPVRVLYVYWRAQYQD